MTLNIFEIILERVLLYIFLEGIMDLAPIYIDGILHCQIYGVYEFKKMFKNHRSFQFLSLKNN